MAEQGRYDVRMPAPSAERTSAQGQYEVRFDWGLTGLRSIAGDAGVIVIVDALPSAGERTDGIAASPQVSAAASRLAGLAAGHDVAVVAATLRNRSAIARWTLARQEDRGERIRVAVVAAGETREDGGMRFAVEDMLAAGAVIDALANVGIDYCSPEAAAACAAYLGLTRATRHLLSASETGVAVIEEGRREAVLRSGDLDVSDDVPVLTHGVFQPGELHARPQRSPSAGG